MLSQKENDEVLNRIKNLVTLNNYADAFDIALLVCQINPRTMPGELFDTVADYYKRIGQDTKERMDYLARARQSEPELSKAMRGNIITEAQKAADTLSAEYGSPLYYELKLNSLAEKLAEKSKEGQEVAYMIAEGARLLKNMQEAQQSKKYNEINLPFEGIQDGDILRGFEESLEYMRICGIGQNYPRVAKAIKNLKYEYRAAFGFAQSDADPAPDDCYSEPKAVPQQPYLPYPEAVLNKHPSAEGLKALQVALTQSFGNMKAWQPEIIKTKHITGRVHYDPYGREWVVTIENEGIVATGEDIDIRRYSKDIDAIWSFAELAAYYSNKKLNKFLTAAVEVVLSRPEQKRTDEKIFNKNQW